MCVITGVKTILKMNLSLGLVKEFQAIDEKMRIFRKYTKKTNANTANLGNEGLCESREKGN